MLTVQVPVPEHAPLQPLNVDPVAGVAVRVTLVPLVNEATQVVPQAMPAGALVTVPLPAPDFVTVRAKDDGSVSVNVAVTDVAALTVTAQTPVPAHPPPLQPENVEPVAGVALKVTTVPLVNAVEQVAPQEMPPGALVTLPLPVPEFVTLSVNDDCTKLAVTAWAALIVTVHVPVPVQPPLQPANVEPAAGVAVNVTAVPLANAAEQVAPHEMPVGALVTVPVPAPALVMASVKGCRANVAVTDWAALIVTVQVPVPVQPPPLQPLKVEPVAGVAVKVTAVPLPKAEEQVVPQEIPAGALEIVPAPVPDLVKVSVKG